MSGRSYILFFSHSPQIRWFSFIARELRDRFGIPSVLWVVGEKDLLEGEQLGSFSEVVNLVGDDSVFEFFKDAASATAYLGSFEEEIQEVFVSRDIAMDRYIAGARWSLEKALIFSAGVLLKIRQEILRTGQPIFALGEENCLHYRLARRSIITPYFCPFMVGHWGDRFYFEYTMYYQWTSCRTEYQAFLLEGIPQELKNLAETKLDDLVARQQRPADTERFIKEGGNSNRLRITFPKLKSLILRTISNILSDREHWNPRYRSALQENVFVSTLRLLRDGHRRREFKKISKKRIPDNVEYAGYFLHMQPEHTVEGVAFSYRDQATTATNIAAALPAGMVLLVKEHFPMVGKRPVSFYQKMLDCPNIVVLDDAINSYEVVKRSKLMFTLSGSVALESMYLGKPAVVLGEVYHSAFHGIYPADDIRDLHVLVASILCDDNAGASRRESVAALAAMYTASYPGLISSQFSLDEMGTAENLNAIMSAFNEELSLLAEEE